MLRTVAIRNEPVLRGLLSKAPRARVSLRLLSTQTLRKLQLRHSNNEIRKLKPTSSWSTNFARAYSDLPKHFKVALPALSPTMEKGTIISWEKKEGDKLNEGDLLAEIETDKATMGFETPEEGYLAKILVQAGTKDVPIGKIVCIIVQKQEDIAAFKDFKDDGAVAAKPPPAPAAPSPSAAATPTPAAPTPASAPAPQTAASSGTRVYASPMAKRLAEVQKLRVEGQGSGVFGSIKSGDLAGLKPAGAAKGKAVAAGAPGPYVDIPVTNMRAVIAKRLLESKQQIPHYYVTMECHVDELLKMRENVNKLHEKDKIRVTVNDFIVKAMATACRKVPETNSSWRGDVIRQFKNVDVSVAVSTNAGLITPIIFGADQKGIIEISTITKELAAKARANKLKPNEFQGGTVCISNMGMFGVHHFEAVINPPQSLILAVGGTQKKLVVDKNDSRGFKEISTMYVTISADHRVVDGAVAAKWLQHFTSFMEKPALMLL